MSRSLVLACNCASEIEPAVVGRSLIRPKPEYQNHWESLLATTGSVLHFAQDSDIYGEGADADTLYRIVSGIVRTCSFLSDGRRHIDSFYDEGDIFGFEVGHVHRLSAEAVSDCTVIAYRRCTVERLASENNVLARQMFSCAMRNMAHAQNHCLLLARKSAVEKVATFLTEWADPSPRMEVTALAMTRQDIADYLGLTIETVSRTLSQLERDAMIELHTARHIRIKNPEALRALIA